MTPSQAADLIEVQRRVADLLEALPARLAEVIARSALRPDLAKNPDASRLVASIGEAMPAGTQFAVADLVDHAEFDLGLRLALKHAAGKASGRAAAQRIGSLLRRAVERPTGEFVIVRVRRSAEGAIWRIERP